MAGLPPQGGDSGVASKAIRAEAGGPPSGGGPAQLFGNVLLIRLQLACVGGTVTDPLAHNQLAAFSTHHYLRIVTLAVAFPLGLAYQTRLRIRQVDLLLRRRQVQMVS